MELKPGYKQTDVGVIPIDWDVKRLREIVTAGPKNGYSGRARSDSSGTPTLRLTATTSGDMRLNDQTIKRLDETIDPSSDLFFQPGDVLIQRSNTPDLVGTTAVFDGPPNTYVYPDLMIRLRVKDESTARWLWSYANSSRGRSYFVSVAAGSTGTMPKITGEKLRRMPIPFPPLAEQRAIEGALSDVDALIGALDQLLAKKRDLKQAAMQQFLTGHQRLPGFAPANPRFHQTDIGEIPEDWQLERLGKVGHWFSGGTPSMADDRYWNGDIPWVSAKDMKVTRLRDSQDHITEMAIGNGTRLAPRGAVLMVIRGMILAHTLPVAFVERPLAFNQDLKALVVRHDIEAEFILRWLQANESRLLGIASASTHGTKRIPSGDLFVTQIALPSPAEQTAIAEVLSDMDAELAALEQKRVKTRLLKQGMMQELLTGRTRLI